MAYRRLLQAKTILTSIIAILSISNISAAPISLEGPNGQGLIWHKLDVKMAIHGPLCLTEMEMVFDNPHNRRVEGTFACELPIGATVSRFAKEVFGKLMEGEVVERKKAVRIYTDILHTPRDPALMEQDQGNRFSTRIWPIEARARTRLILTYSQVIPVNEQNRREFRVPLAGLPRIGNFSLSAVCRPLPGAKVTADTSWFGLSLQSKGTRVYIKQPRQKKNFQPKRDFVVLVETEEQSVPIRVVAGRYQMVLVRPNVETRTEESSNHKRWNIYFDTSASMATASEYRIAVLKSVLTNVSEAFPEASVKLLAFDLEQNTICQKKTANIEVSSILHKLKRRGFLGATNLEKVLAHLGKEARATKKAHTFVLFTDGIPTLGSRRVDKLLSALGTWPKRHKLKIIVTGTTENEQVTRAIAEKTQSSIIRVCRRADGSSRAEEAFEKLVKPSGATIRLRDDEAQWIYPRTFYDVHQGQEIIAFAKLGKKKKSRLQMKNALGKSKTIHSQLMVPKRFLPLIKREAWRSYLNALAIALAKTKEEKERARLQKLMVKVSQKHRVLCPLTSLLVLESEWDYERYKINRRALSDILVVTSDGVGNIKRKYKKKKVGDFSEADAAFGVADTSNIKVEPFDPKKPRRSMHIWGAPSAEWVTQKGSLSKKDEALYQAHREGRLTPGRVADESKKIDLSKAVGKRGDVESFSAPSVLHQLQRVRRVRMRVASEQKEFASRMVEFIGEEAAAYSLPPQPHAIGALTGGDSGDEYSMLMQKFGGSSGFDRAASRKELNKQYKEKAAKESYDYYDTLRQKFEMEERRRELNWWLDSTKTAKGAKELKRLGAGAQKSKKFALKTKYAKALVAAKKWSTLRVRVKDWLRKIPYEPTLYSYLGFAFKGLKKSDTALRAFTSIAEVVPNSSTILNHAGYIMLSQKAYREAEDFFSAAIERRPDQHNPYRGLALALWYQEKFEEAAKVLEKALSIDFHPRYRNIQKLLRSDLTAVYYAWLKADPEQYEALEERSKKHDVLVDVSPKVRITLLWDADASDLNLFVISGDGHKFNHYSNNKLGWKFSNSVSQGLGPEEIKSVDETIKAGRYFVGIKRGFDPMGMIRAVVYLQRPAEGIHPNCDFFFTEVHRSEVEKKLFVTSFEIE